MSFRFKKQYIPNALLIFRILIAIVIFVLFMCEYYRHKPIVYHIPTWGTDSLFYLIVGVLFIVGCITDWLDGYLARKYNWISKFGQIWDPIADKILIDITLIGLTINNKILWWLTVIMIIRDVIVDGSRIYAASKNKVVAASVYGKLKTAFQMIAIIWVLFIYQHADYASGIYGDTLNEFNIKYIIYQNGLLIIATIFSVISGANYIWRIHKTK